jgi:hypothetical protein
MTPEQYDRWQDFAIRMARTCFKRNCRPYSYDIIDAVEDFFACVEGGGFEYDSETVLLIRDWDNCDPYPEGHRFHRVDRTGPCGCCYHDGYMSGKNPPRADCEHCGGTGLRKHYLEPMCVPDVLSESFYEQWIPSYRRIPDEHYQEARDQWAGPIECCLRAGLGAAIDGGSGMGVMGFTAGDIRRMYPEGVPDWIARQWDDGETIGAKAVCPGVGFVPEVVGASPKFEDMEDNNALWL